jgi:hypothetical protein
MLCSLLFILCFGYNSLLGQTAFVSSYNEPSGTNGKVSYTVGQSFTLHATGTNGSTVNGIQQPFSIYTLGVTNNFDQVEISIYPNPVSNVLVLKMEFEKLEKMNYTLCNANGSLIYNKQITENETLIDLSDLQAAPYILHVMKSGKDVKSFKIVKH